jgi:tetratricopeptide (TPR) repeat protein
VAIPSTPLKAAVLVGLALSLAAPAPARADALAPAPSADEPAFAPADLDAMLAAIDAARDPASRLEATKPMLTLPESALPAIAQKLEELRKASSVGLTEAVRLANRAAKGGDLLGALVELEEGDRQGTRSAIATVALVRGLARIGTTPAIRQLLQIGADHGGVLRPELARLVRELGDRAVPALIRTRTAPSIRSWAYGQLEAMGKRIPGDAVQTKDNQVLADVLDAYATIHDLDALPVILSFVNSDRVLVRAAARDAVAKYGQDAIWKLREAYANLTGNPAPDGWLASDVARELFAAYDRFRLQEVHGLLDQGLAKYKQGDVAGAVADFDKVLARQPMLDRRGEMVAAYVAHAQALEEQDEAQALAIFRKAARLAPDGPRASQIAAEVAYLEGKELLSRGIADAEPFRRALSLNPGHAGARAELDRLESSYADRDARIQGMAGAAAVIVLSLTGIILFAGRRRPKRPARA